MTGLVNVDASLPCAFGAVWREWLVHYALPLWSERGFDSAQCLYYERLTWDGRPIALSQRRLMVQARQIATYCRAGLDGLYDASAPALAQALQCLETVERLYWRVDGEAGWIFSLALDGGPGESTRDLYAHAFILFSYAWAYRLTGNPHYKRMARETAAEIWQLFSTDGEGFLSSVPMVDIVRRQNPHMHLLEACLALFEATGDDFYRDQAQNLVRLACRRFVDARSGALLEEFDERWAPLKPSGRNRVEPGHLFEWAWLLGEYRRLACCAIDEDEGLHEVAERLFIFAKGRGSVPDTGLVYDAVTDDGAVLESSTRIWPQTEFLRLLCQRREAALLTSLSRQFFLCYAPSDLKGGWIDRLDKDGAPIVDHMPASSFYHIYGAGRVLAGF